MSGSRISVCRSGASVLSVLAATVLCAACTSATKGTPILVHSSSSVASNSSIPSSPGPTTAPPTDLATGLPTDLPTDLPTGLPTGVGGSKDPFCAELNGGDLSGLGGGNSPQKVVDIWDKLAADAPAANKPDAQAIDKYLHNAIAGKINAVDGRAVSTAAEHIGIWTAAHCS